MKRLSLIPPILVAFQMKTFASLNESKSKDHKQGYNLERVVLIFRHGARTPISNVFPGNKSNEVYFWDINEMRLKQEDLVPALTVDDPQFRIVSEHNTKQETTKFPGGCSVGELTKLGREQAINLGNELRKRYVEELKLLPTQPDASLLELRSTNVNRTIETLRGVLFGIYGNNFGSALHVTVASEEDETLTPNFTCERLHESYKLQRQNFFHETKTNTLRLQLADLFQTEPTNINFVNIRDLVIALKTHGKVIPEFLDNKPILDNLEKASVEQVFSVLIGLSKNDVDYPQKGLQLSAAPLVHEVCSRVSALDTQHKLTLLSGHDTSIMPLMCSLGYYEHVWPDFCSNVAFEVYLKNDHRYVRVVRNGQWIPISGCSEYCPMNKFLDHFSSFLSIEEHKNACKIEDQNVSNSNTPSGTSL
eukprot:c11838_g1_i1.p1 GENE.c11838_g1_i1~~c11838_g1_i1.p1  ORF type:complete len:429 (-),score=129.85 c11838_g1_i1:19-1278(-)